MAPTDEHWRSLAARIQAETDPDKLIELVKQLIARFDEHLRQHRPPDSDVA